MDQHHYLSQQAALARQWLATQEVIRRLIEAGQATPGQLAVVFEVLEAIERDRQDLDARHYQVSIRA